MRIPFGACFGSKNESTLPDYYFLFAQLEYWEAIYLEAERFWLQRN